MQIVRTIVWVLLFVGLLAFSFFNWKPVEVTIWNNLILETKVPALVIVSFLLGLIPTWLLHRGVKWRLHRRIKTLENAARAAAVSNVSDENSATNSDAHEPYPSREQTVPVADTTLATYPATTTLRPDNSER